MTLTMNPEIRDLWADALESGKYAQTTGALRKPESGFCCLGVLCDLAVKAGVIPDPKPTFEGGDELFIYGDDVDQSYTGLPLSVVEWAGMREDDEGYSDVIGDPLLTDVNGHTKHAAGWNDEGGATFAEIAAMVRLVPAPELVNAD